MTEIPEHLLKRAQEAREKASGDDSREERLARIKEAMENRPRYVSRDEATSVSAKNTARRAQRLAGRYPPDRERVWDITLTRFNSLTWGWEVSEFFDDKIDIRTSVKGSALTMSGARRKAERYIRKRGF